MARKSRVEFAGARYHVINRGNYRSWIFETKGARRSFLKCLDEVCRAMDWRLHAWCLMGNHYHLCLETSAPNLVEGMRWLQSTFANRFNRFNRVQGHVFQGRYRAILLDGSALGTVCHYIHLNPVRAGVEAVQTLHHYEDSSYARLWVPAIRRPYERLETALLAAGQLADTPAGRQKYRDYLAWLVESDIEQKRLGFEQMSRGWAHGSKEYKQSILEKLDSNALRKVVESEAAPMREYRWQQGLSAALKALGRSPSDLAVGRKGEEWKVSLARYLRESCLAPHRWIALQLKMGAPSYVQSLVSRHRREPESETWQRLKHEKLD